MQTSNSTTSWDVPRLRSIWTWVIEASYALASKHAARLRTVAADGVVVGVDAGFHAPSTTVVVVVAAPPATVVVVARTVVVVAPAVVVVAAAVVVVPATATVESVYESFAAPLLAGCAVRTHVSFCCVAGFTIPADDAIVTTTADPALNGLLPILISTVVDVISAEL